MRQRRHLRAYAEAERLSKVQPQRDLRAWSASLRLQVLQVGNYCPTKRSERAQ